MDKSKRNTVLGVIAVLVLAIAGWRFWSGSGPAVRVPDRFTAQAVCLNCRQEQTLTYDRRESPPFTCGACGERAVYLWWYCHECHRRFVPRLVAGDPPRPENQPSCPGCGCEVVSGYIPELHAAEGEVELPQWKRG